jgi:hypothetical protein
MPTDPKTDGIKDIAAIVIEPVNISIEKLHADLAVLTEREANNTEATSKALELQAVEIARRLDILNGEAQRLRDIQSTYLPREVYEVATKEILNKIEVLNTFMANYQGRGTVIATVTSTAISIGIGLLFLALNYLLRK